MAKVIVFGQQDYAEQAHYYLTHDSPHDVVAFCVTDDFHRSDSVFGLPLVRFESVQEDYPPDDFVFFIPMSGRSINRLRQRFYEETKAKGYRFISYVSSRATLCGNTVGENCFILENTNVQPFTRIGNNVVIWCNSHIGHHGTIGDHAWIATQVVVSGRCTVGANCYLATQTLIEANVSLGRGTLAGSFSYITRDTEEWSIYTGNPAKKRKLDSRNFEFL